MLTFVTFLWRQSGYRTVYTPEHVRRWARQVGEHYEVPHRCVVITDLDGDFGAAEAIRDPHHWSKLRNPEGRGFPDCYRRLWIWSREAADVLGDRIVMMDLDISIVGSLHDVVDRVEPVVMARDALWKAQYNGGVQVLTAGARPDVWERFEGEPSIKAARAKGFRGSDQAWLSFVLGPDQATLQGVHSWKRDLKRGLPRPDSRVVMFHGQDKPWHDAVPKVYR